MSALEEAAGHWRECLAAGEIEEGAARVQEALGSPSGDAPSVERVRVLYAAHIFAFRLGQPSFESSHNRRSRRPVSRRMFVVSVTA